MIWQIENEKWEMIKWYEKFNKMIKWNDEKCERDERWERVKSNEKKKYY